MGVSRTTASHRRKLLYPLTSAQRVLTQDGIETVTEFRPQSGI